MEIKIPFVIDYFKNEFTVYPNTYVDIIQDKLEEINNKDIKLFLVDLEKYPQAFEAHYKIFTEVQNVLNL